MLKVIDYQGTPRRPASMKASYTTQVCIASREGNCGNPLICHTSQEAMFYTERMSMQHPSQHGQHLSGLVQGSLWIWRRTDDSQETTHSPSHFPTSAFLSNVDPNLGQNKISHLIRFRDFNILPCASKTPE